MQRMRKKAQLEQRMNQKIDIIKQKLLIREQILQKKISRKQSQSLRAIENQLRTQNIIKMNEAQAKIKAFAKEIAITKTKYLAENDQQKILQYKMNAQNQSIKAIKGQIQQKVKGYQVNAKILQEESAKIKSECQILVKTIAIENKIAQSVSHHTANQQRMILRHKELRANCAEEIKRTKFQNKKINLHVQEERGNIRVYCRIRPFRQQQEQQVIYKLDAERTVLSIKIPDKLLRSSNNESNYSFMFQKIFDIDQNQRNVFEQLQHLISCTIQGNNVCIFAYGQTGSGKTFTMQGLQNQNEGVIPRSVNMLFKQIQEQKQSGWTFKVTLQIQQIYLDEVKNLIVNTEKSEKKNQSSENQVKNQLEVRNLFEKAQKIRKTASTKCNADSSRSHLIFTLKIDGKCGNIKKQGSLVIVDLAGSQRMEQSGVQGQRQKQTIAINSSLSSLGKMIYSLAANGKDKTKQVHVPYRQSKLTKFLQPYMTNGSKVLMFVNISANAGDISQTISSLRFAESVQQTKVKKKN